MSLSYICTDDGYLTLMAKGRSFTLGAEHPNYKKILKLLETDDEEQVYELVDVKRGIESYSGDRVKILNGVVYYKGEAIHNNLTKRIIALSSKGLPFKPMLAFLNNLEDNPSYDSRQQLYNFLEQEHLPITEDGCFLGYKMVRENWMDQHSGKCDNHIGKILEMPRKEVDDNPNHACSHGFHVGSIQYVQGYQPGGGSGHAIIVKVNPRDVVAVPIGEAHKLRTARYEVVDEYQGPLDEPCYNSCNIASTADDFGDIEDNEY